MARSGRAIAPGRRAGAGKRASALLPRRSLQSDRPAQAGTRVVRGGREARADELPCPQGCRNRPGQAGTAGGSNGRIPKSPRRPTTVISVRIDDLAFFDGEAIVRPVNEDLGATTPLLRRLELAAGTQLYNQIRLQEPLPVGAAVVTSAGELPAELLVHAVVMSRSEPVTVDAVRRALTSALQRVESWQIKQVAIPPFGLGAGNLDVHESARVMVDVIVSHVGSARFPEDITLITETAEEERAFSTALERSGI